MHLRLACFRAALDTYDNTTVSVREILGCASHYADFVLKGEVEWGESGRYERVIDLMATKNAR